MMGHGQFFYLRVYVGNTRATGKKMSRVSFFSDFIFVVFSIFFRFFFRFCSYCQHKFSMPA